MAANKPKQLHSLARVFTIAPVDKCSDQTSGPEAIKIVPYTFEQEHEISIVHWKLNADKYRCFILGTEALKRSDELFMP